MEANLLPLIIGLVLIIAGLGTVAWLMWNEKKQLDAQTPENHDGADTVTETPKKSQRADLTPATLLRKLGLAEERSIGEEAPIKNNLLSQLLKSLSSLFKKKPKEDTAIATPFPTKLPEEFNRMSAKNTTGTASLRLDQDLSIPSPNATVVPTAPTLTGLEAESDWAFRYDELQRERDSLKERFERLDTLFKEKGDAFDKSEKALASESKNRKEFNKVKDLLEKELKENKDKSREQEVRLAGAQTESSAYLKRVNQLEERIKKLEKDILENETGMNEAQGQIQGRQKLITDLEEKLKAQERMIHEKQEKINEIVGRMSEGGAASPTPRANEPPPVTAEEKTPEIATVGIPVTETPMATIEPPAAPVKLTSVSMTEEELPTAPTTEPIPTESPAMEEPKILDPEPLAEPSTPEPEPSTPEPSETAATIEHLPEPTPAAPSQEPEAETALPENPIEEPTAQLDRLDTPPPVAERGNIILQAIEYGQQIPAENAVALKTETETPVVPTETEPSTENLTVLPEQPEEPQQAESPQPAAPISEEKIELTENTSISKESSAPTLKLAPDILAEQPLETPPAENTENPPLTKTETPNT